MKKFLLLMLVFFASGCASRSKMMVPAKLDISNKSQKTVNIEVNGGQETNPLWTSQISSDDFREAATSAVITSGLFSSVIRGNKANYLLKINLLEKSQPLIGIDIDIALKTKWKLVDNKTGDVVWADTISSTYRVKMSECFVAAERVQRANEGAARENIKEALTRLSKQEL